MLSSFLVSQIWYIIGNEWELDTFAYLSNNNYQYDNIVI